MKDNNKCSKCGADNWMRDNSRPAHGRPPRFFVVCKSCGNRAQAIMEYGYLIIFQTGTPKQFVKMLVDITPEHKAWLEKFKNQSGEVRELLDKEINAVKTPNTART